MATTANTTTDTIVPSSSKAIMEEDTTTTTTTTSSPLTKPEASENNKNEVAAVSSDTDSCTEEPSHSWGDDDDDESNNIVMVTSLPKLLPFGSQAQPEVSHGTTVSSGYFQPIVVEEKGEQEEQDDELQGDTATSSDGEISETNEIVQVLQSMKCHADHAALQAKSCSALAVLATASAENRREIAAQEGVPVVLDAMATFPDHAAVQWHACCALSSLALDDELQTWMGRIHHNDTIQRVLAAMEHHFDNAAVQSAALCALANIAVPETNQKVIGTQTDGIARIVAALVRYATENDDDAPVAQQACCALANLALAHGNNRTQIAAQGGITAILAAMTTSNSSHNDATTTTTTTAREVQYQAVRALGSLAHDSQDNGLEICRAGGLQAVVTVMHDLEADRNLQYRACRTLANLVVNDVNRKLLVRDTLGGVESVLYAMRSHAEDAAVQTYGCWMIKNFGMSNSKTVRQKLRLTGGLLETITAAMQAHPQDHPVQEQGCQALYFLTFSYPKAQLVNSGVVPLAEAARDNFGLEHADRLLQKLVGKKKDSSKNGNRRGWRLGKSPSSR